MKKLMFTAIAMVAFSSVSLADKPVVKNLKIEKVTLKPVTCDIAWNIAYHYARQAGFSNSEANNIAFAAYDNCLGCDN